MIENGAEMKYILSTIFFLQLCVTLPVAILQKWDFGSSSDELNNEDIAKFVIGFLLPLIYGGKTRGK